MSKKRKYKGRRKDESELPEFSLSPATKRGVLIVVFVILAVLSFLSFFNSAGVVGRTLHGGMGMLFGWAAVAAPLLFFSVALALFLAARAEAEDPEEMPASNLRVYLGAILLTFALTGLLHLIAMRSHPDEAFALVRDEMGGGYIGVLTALPLFKLVDFWAAFAILLGALLVGIVILFNINPAKLKRVKLEAEENGSETKPKKSLEPASLSGVKSNQMASSGWTPAKVQKQEPVPEALEPKPTAPEDMDIARKVETATGPEPVDAKFRKGTWQLPSVALLEDSETSVDSGNIEANVTIIQKTLADFGIEVEMGEVNVGPTVTQYTLRPDPGIKLSQILALQNDLALALAASAIRIEAPIPGKALVGIEVPNKATAVVRLKDIIQTESFIT